MAVEEMRKSTESRVSDKCFDNAMYPLEDERTDLGISCDKCDGSGWIFKSDGGHGSARKCSCMTEFYNRRRVKRSGLEHVLKSKTFDTFSENSTWQKAVKKTAQEFVKSSGTWFFIGGAVGSGKTHICSAICAELIKEKSVKYAPWRETIVPIKSSVCDAVEYARLMNPLKTVDVLYLDDFFKGNVTDGDKNVAFELLNYRYNAELITILSTEFFISGLIAIDEAVGSRIAQMSREFCCEVENGDGKNWRLEARLKG